MPSEFPDLSRYSLGIYSFQPATGAPKFGLPIILVDCLSRPIGSLSSPASVTNHGLKILNVDSLLDINIISLAFIDLILAVLNQNCTCFCDFVIFINAPLNYPARVDTFKHQNHVS